MGITQQTDNITDIRLVQKTGGVHGDYLRNFGEKVCQ
jgi:hypothetical protein